MVVGIHCWCDLIWSKQLSSVFVWHAQMFGGFSGHGSSIYKSHVSLIWWRYRSLQHNRKSLASRYINSIFFHILPKPHTSNIHRSYKRKLFPIKKEEARSWWYSTETVTDIEYCYGTYIKDYNELFLLLRIPGEYSSRRWVNSSLTLW